MSTSGREAANAPAGLLKRLVDDAAIFPPGNAALRDAVPAHEQHRTSWYAELVGPFLCSDQRLPELQRALSAEGEPLALGLVVAGGAGAIEPALVWVSREQRATLAAVEVALRSTDDLAAGARRIVAALDVGLGADEIPAYVEMPRPDDPLMLGVGWLSALDVIASAGHRVKYRTGGSHTQDFPGEWELAHMLASAFDRELAVKCTAGLHGAVRRTAPATGFEEHGFLNVMLATRAALDGADTADLAATLGRRDRDAVAADVRALTSDQAASTRRWFASFGSCSVSEPLDELVELGLYAKEMVSG